MRDYKLFFWVCNARNMIFMKNKHCKLRTIDLCKRHLICNHRLTTKKKFCRKIFLSPDCKSLLITYYLPNTLSVIGTSVEDPTGVWETRVQYWQQALFFFTVWRDYPHFFHIHLAIPTLFCTLISVGFLGTLIHT